MHRSCIPHVSRVCIAKVRACVIKVSDVTRVYRGGIAQVSRRYRADIAQVSRRYRAGIAQVSRRCRAGVAGLPPRPCRATTSGREETVSFVCVRRAGGR